MRVGIYTLPLNFNYGGLLQAYALQQTLKQLGHESVVIDRPLYEGPFGVICIIRFFKRVVKKFLFLKDIHIFHERYLRETFPVVSKWTSTFVDNYIKKITVKNTSLLRESEFDALIVGSDQIWRYKFHNTSQKVYDSFLYFAKEWNIPKIAYAASFGVDVSEYPPDIALKCSGLLKKFKAISVREKSGVALCEKIFSVNAQWVLDPTMLLDVNMYIELAGRGVKDFNCPEHNLVCYILDENPQKNRIVSALSEKIKRSVYRINSRAEDEFAPLTERIQPPVESWLYNIKNADYVVTDSFHACIFSILFKKDFLVIMNSKRGIGRILSLLKLFDLEDRLIFASDEDFVLPASSVENAAKCIHPLREKSISFLEKALEKTCD
ncbi:MAG: polysaccharide pyruvyl transferase family protein [Fibrobacteraceae bacterium]|nr:polysaccharide pyruvyl transferase family protein [Fibrobacteraceae bacterium]